jgi:hypothetical protein
MKFFSEGGHLSPIRRVRYFIVQKWEKVCHKKVRAVIRMIFIAVNWKRSCLVISGLTTHKIIHRCESLIESII